MTNDKLRSLLKDRRIFAVAACDQNRGIGKDNGIPWQCKHDLEHFAALTHFSFNGDTPFIIMGRKTWEGIGRRHFSERKLIVLSRNPDPKIDASSPVFSARHFEEALCLMPSGATIYVCGGENVYRSLLKYCEGLFLSEIPGRYDCDAFFPEFDCREDLSPINSVKTGQRDGFILRYFKICQTLSSPK